MRYFGASKDLLTKLEHLRYSHVGTYHYEPLHALEYYWDHDWGKDLVVVFGTPDWNWNNRIPWKGYLDRIHSTLEEI